MTLFEFLAWLLGSGGIGVLCSRLLEWLDERWAAFSGLRPDLKRLATFAMTAVTASALGVIALLVQQWAGGEAAPITAQDWVSRLFELAAAAIITSQVTHASRQQTKRVEAEKNERWRIVMGE
jgi:hypothetical protein